MSVSTPAIERRPIRPGLDQFVLRELIVIGAATAVVAAQAAGARPGPWHLGVLLALALQTAIRPESIAGMGLLAGAAYTWVMTPETQSPLVLVAAAGMVLVHVCALVAAQGPARMRVDRAQLRRWAARALFLWLAAVVVWGLSLALADLPQGRLAYASGLTLLAVIAVAATWLIESGQDRT